MKITPEAMEELGKVAWDYRTDLIERLNIPEPLTIQNFQDMHDNGITHFVMNIEIQLICRVDPGALVILGRMRTFTAELLDSGRINWIGKLLTGNITINEMNFTGEVALKSLAKMKRIIEDTYAVEMAPLLLVESDELSRSVILETI